MRALLLVFFIGFFTISCATSSNVTEERNLSSLVVFVELVSGSDPRALKEIKAYIDNRSEYILQNQEHLWDEDFVPKESLIDTLIVSSILMKYGYILYRDSSYEPDLFLSDVNELSKGALGNLACFKSLQLEYKKSSYGIANYLTVNQLGSTPYECVNSAGLALVAVNDDSDSLLFFLVRLEMLSNVVQAASDSGISLYFADQNA